MRYWGEIEVVRAFSSAGEDGPAVPPIDLYETADAFVIECDLPGVGADSLAVSLQGKTVFIGCGSRETPSPGAELRYHCMERYPEAFVREIPLPGSVHTGETRARYEHGVLTITLPKVLERRGRKVTIPVERV